LPKPTQPSAASRSTQVERFRELARELETDDSPEEFERVFGKIAPPKKAGDITIPKPTKKP
jgi:hypothetical protein